MVDLLLGNTPNDQNSYCTSGQAYRVLKTAVETGNITEIRVDRFSSSRNVKVGLYTSSGSRLWYGSGYINTDDTQIVVSPGVDVEQGTDYYFYIAAENDLGPAVSLNGTDYDVEYTTSLSYSDTPPSSMGGYTWNDDTKRDICMRANGDIAGDVDALFLGGGF